ncbi:exodeoxyribonuclease VII large subunit [Gracilibacillus kekensis]|uniref:Exodeoxyribonuclease 7 large subunit n=1 Tax=Gracilibacillus kekensis TaxID=1027249 RepID=A0A1M7P7E5_9BACI|nr:exodeoxyribonuclease VII large subunit [Gracilibacillus kekensis]SHN12530.1 Exodeoxyribonuclease VII large subunit [Gracilibacillus kekensis]
MEERYLSVTALTKYIKKKFDVDQHLNHIWLKGEISNFKHHSRGHMYMTIKDDNASIRAVMFQRQNQSLPFTPENGMKILLTGHVSVFEIQGQYQLYIQDMQPDGIGALHLAFEQLKEKLFKEGLFDKVHKKDLPKYPSQIAVLTSPTGAAIRDILTTLERRYPIAHILIIPVLVQGKQATKSIVDGIISANQFSEIDLIIVGRGGGSLEELWCFNEEEVARAIFQSELPVISAVGHETDITISDMVADVRAPTPTAAAELAVPSKLDLIEKIINLDQFIYKHMIHKIEQYEERLSSIEKSYVFKYPERLVEEKEQRLDRAMEHITKHMDNLITSKTVNYHNIEKRFSFVLTTTQIKHKEEKVSQLMNRLHRASTQHIDNKKNAFSKKLSQLDLLNPTRIMSRGYSITYKKDRSIIKSIENLRKKDAIVVRLTDGHAECTIDHIRKEDQNERKK